MIKHTLYISIFWLCYVSLSARYTFAVVTHCVFSDWVIKYYLDGFKS